MHGLLLDHEDSFTANLSSWLRQRFQITVIKHTEFIAQNSQKKNFDFMVLSAGPKSPNDYKASIKFLEHQKQIEHTNQIPVLGVCLGMQMMVQVCDGSVVPYSAVMHGKTSNLKFNTQLEGIEKKSITVARYHSLECLPSSEFSMIANSQNDHRAMWVEHKNLPWLGWQFHPESFLTDQSDLLLSYFEKWLISRVLK
jgi:para-aminobenzoate synthetase component II